jgi:hypothetical protein
MNRHNNSLQLRSSLVRDEFDLSASDSLMTPSSPILLSVLSESGRNNEILLWRLRNNSAEFDWSASDNLMVPSAPIQLSVLSEEDIEQ